MLLLGYFSKGYGGFELLLGLVVLIVVVAINALKNRK